MDKLPDVPCGWACGQVAKYWVHVGYRPMRDQRDVPQWTPLCQTCAEKAQWPMDSTDVQLDSIPIAEFA